jgi:hypothetical protein
MYLSVLVDREVLPLLRRQDQQPRAADDQGF